MLQSLIITLREGIEAALIVGLTLSYLEKTGRRHLKPAVWTALGLAILGSVIGAYVLQSVVDVSEEVVEGTLMLVAAIFVGTTMIWMHRASRHLSGDIRKKVDDVAASGGGGWALGLFVFFMVVREGAETVLFLSAVSFNSSGLSSLVGALLGLGLAAFFAVAFFKGAIQLDLKRFFFATTFILGVLVVELLLHSYHEYSEIGWLPANQSTMAIVGPAVKNSVLFVLALLALPMVLYLAPSAARAPDAAPVEDGPEARKTRAAAFRRKAWGVTFLAVGSSIVGLLFFDYLASKNKLSPGPATKVVASGGAVTLPISGLAPDTQHLYVVEVAGHPVRFFVWILGHEPRVCLDACEICGSMGYVQEGRQLTCINCGAEIYPPSLGQAGGCNPIPVPFTFDDGVLTIREDALAENAAAF